MDTRKTDFFCQMIKSMYPKEKNSIREKIENLIMASEDNRERFWNIIDGRFSISKNPQNEIIITSTQYCCGEELPRYTLVIGEKEAHIEVAGEEK